MQITYISGVRIEYVGLVRHTTNLNLELFHSTCVRLSPTHSSLHSLTALLSTCI